MQHDENLDHLARMEVDKQLAAFKCGRGKLKVPAPLGLMQLRPRGHFHFTPEIFIQLSGCTGFIFPREQMRLAPGDMCVIPVGLSHSENVRFHHRPFRNLVIGFDSMAVSWHLAQRKKDTEAECEMFRNVQTPDTAHAIDYLADLVEAYHSKTPAREAKVRGLALATLATVRALMEGSRLSRSHEPYKVAQCRHYILKNIGDPELNVKKLAARIECSAGYLSYVFRCETGMNLIAYIQQQRVSQAKSLLDSSPFNIAEVGQAVGYDDPGYFCRVFRRIAGQTPKHYRNRNSSRS